MVTRITSSNIEPGSITTDRLASGVSGGPKIINVQVSDQSYTVLDDTAISTLGGYVRITGSGFNTGCSVLVGNSVATSTSFVSSNFLNAQLPALPAGTYPMYVVNPDGATAIRVNAITYSLTPTWITGSTLPSQVVDASFSLQLNATSNSSVVYSVASGSSLPAGVTLSSAGLLSGTVTGLAQDTVFSFIVEAIDAENQESPRTFSVTISAGDGNINQTMLLLQADTETFITDASANNFTITPVADTRPSAFSPYNTGWSNYFDGSSYFTSSTALFNYTTGNAATETFTIEAWVYHVARTSPAYFYLNQSIACKGDIYMNFGINGSGNLIFYHYDGTQRPLTSSSVIPLHTWTHVAVVVSGGTATVYINGVSDGSGTWYGIAAAGQNSTSYFGRPATNASALYFQGYISNLRVSSTARSITVPTDPYSNDGNTVFLTEQSNRFVDNSSNGYAITLAGTPKVKSFGPFTDTDTTTGSGYFDGTGDYLTAAANSAFQFGTGDFTIEFWFYPTSLSSYQTSIDMGYNNSGSYVIQTGNGNGIPLLYSGGSTLLTSSSAWSLNAWNHVAVVRSGTTLSMFINGSRTATNSTNSTNFNANFALGIGGSPTHSTPAEIDGYLSNVRIVKGSAIYDPTSTTLTVPTAPLTAISGTSLLTLQNRIGYNNSQPVDLSGVRNIITRNGNASVGSYSPYVPTGWSVNLATDRSVSFTGNASTTLDGDFTWEAWVYLTSYVGGGFNELTILTNRSDTSVGTIIDISNSNASSPGTFGLWYNGSTVFVTPGAGDVPLNVWTHLAITREGTGTNNLKAFINGVLKAQTTSTATFFGTNTMYIGDSMYNQQFNNYMSNMRMIKGRALYTTSAVLDTAVFAPPAYTLSPTEDTSFLLFRDGSYTIDSGPQRLAITPGASAPIAVPFSPFKLHTIAPDSYSVYFDGNGDYLTVPDNAAFEFGSGDFTIEALVYPTAGSLNQLIIAKSDRDTPGGEGPFTVQINNTNKVQILFSSGGEWDINVAGPTTVAINTWNHIVVTRSSDTFRLFLNGVLETTATSLISLSDNAQVLTIGILGYTSNTFVNPFFGYISNLRLVKGSVVSAYSTSSTTVGASIFTPPTSPLTAVSGTSLLTCQSPTVIDNSTNNFAITVNGNSQPTKFNPFGEPATTGIEYSPTSHGGSVYFDGTGDNLKVPHSEDLTVRNGDFTIEFWLYLPGSMPGSGACFLTKGWGSYAPYLFYSNGSSMVFYSSSNGSSWDVSSAQVIGALKLSTWMHICVSRQGTSIKGFMDGVQGFSITSSATLYVNTTTVTIAAADNGGGNINGYYSGIRMIKGRSIYNNQAFVPSTAPLERTKDTVLLINGTNAAIQDKTGRHVLETIGTVRVSNSEIKYGTGAISFDGISGGLLSPFRDEFSFGTGDFTVEGWFYFNDIATNAKALVGLGDGANGSGPIYTSWVLQYLGSDGSNQLRFYRYDGTSYAYVTTGLTLSANVWTHIAASRIAGTLKIFVNGQSYYSNTVSQTFAAINTNPLRVGLQYYGPAAGYGGPRYFNGYMDDIRITKGVGRYDLPFDPPGKHLAR